MLTGSLFLMFVNLTNTAFSMLKCDELADGKFHLCGDYEVVCWEGEHLFYVTAATVFIGIYPIGVPLTLGLVLTSHAMKGTLYAKQDASGRDLAKGGLVAHDNAWIQALSGLFILYKKKAYYFQVGSCC